MDVYQTAVGRVRKDARLSHIEKLLYLFLVDLTQEQGSIHMSMRALTQETGISSAALVPAIPRLKELGYIRASKLPGKSGHENYLIYVDMTAEEPKPVQTMEARINGVKVTIRVEKE